MGEEVKTQAVRGLIHTDHWADPGGRTVSALKEILSDHLGTAVRSLECEFITSIEQLRQATFGVVGV